MEQIKQEIQELKQQFAFFKKELNLKKTPEFLTSNEVMEWLKISRQTLHRWKKDGVLIAYNLGGKMFFKRAEIIAMIEDSKVAV